MIYYDDYDNCTNCGSICEFYQLTDYLIHDIQELEKEVVRLRYELSRLLNNYHGYMIRCEIFSDLSGRYYWHPAYEQYVKAYHDGSDPMESADFNKQMSNLSKGKEIV